jgi:aromatic ring-opening dioxygenase catalytic subunit (LigB family)
MGEPETLARMTTYLRGLRDLPKERPRALLSISAHWEEPAATVMTSAAPPMLYDYYGFPASAYELRWPAPGDPALAARVQALLAAAGLESAADATRGFDHGTFVPFMLTYPEADLPTIQLSLIRGLDPRAHLALGRALAPLRDEGVFIVGSGMSYHNMRGFGPAGRAASLAFDGWLRETTALGPEKRDDRLTAWAEAPSARAAHPREEHLLPLMVVAGAAGADRGHVAYEDTLFGVQISAHHFG